MASKHYKVCSILLNFVQLCSPLFKIVQLCTYFVLVFYVGSFLGSFLQYFSLIVILGMLLKFSAICSSNEVGSLESLYRRRSTKPLVMEISENFNHASAPDHLNINPEDPSDTLSDDQARRISLSAFRQVSCPEFVLQLQEKTRNIRKIHSMGS